VAVDGAAAGIVAVADTIKGSALLMSASFIIVATNAVLLKRVEKDLVEA